MFPNRGDYNLYAITKIKDFSPKHGNMSTKPDLSMTNELPSPDKHNISLNMSMGEEERPNGEGVGTGPNEEGGGKKPEERLHEVM